MHPIGIAARRSGVTIETIRYYEREGVVPRAQRSASGRRLYDEQAISRLRFVRRCRDLGFSIPNVKLLLDLTGDKPRSCDEARAIGQTNLSLVRLKIADLQRMERALGELVALCDEGQTECPMLARLFSD